MALKLPKKPLKKKTNKPAAAPVPQPKRELTRAEKTAQARDAAAKRNAQLVSPAPEQKKAPVSAAAKRPAPRRDVKTAKKPAPRRTLSRQESKKEHQANARKEINRKINTQTRAHRHEEKSNKRVSGSIKNLEIKRRSTERNHSFRVKRKRAGLGKLLLVRLVLFLVIFAVMFSVTAGLFSLTLRPGSEPKGKAYTLQLGEDIPKGKEYETPDDQKPTYQEIPAACATRYGNLYIPVSALSDMCSLTVTGSTEELRYLPRESEGQSMKFVVGSDIAYVNGTKVRMLSPSFLYDSKLYVPLDFMQKYSNGLTIKVDEANRKITLHKNRVGYDAQTDTDLFSTLGFNLYTTVELTQAEYPDETDQ